jgi:hypothetical protein
MLHHASHQAIDALFLEERRYPPPPELAKTANAQPGIYDRDFAEFWATEARERVTWSTPFEQVCEWDPPYAKWFLGVGSTPATTASTGTWRPVGATRSPTTGRESPTATGAR